MQDFFMLYLHSCDRKDHALQPSYFSKTKKGENHAT